ncbi:MAG: hypothetical protein ACRDRK_03745 [Pseudonocardia sp.]
MTAVTQVEIGGVAANRQVLPSRWAIPLLTTTQSAGARTVTITVALMSGWSKQGIHPMRVERLKPSVEVDLAVDGVNESVHPDAGPRLGAVGSHHEFVDA